VAAAEPLLGFPHRQASLHHLVRKQDLLCPIQRKQAPRVTHFHVTGQQHRLHRFR
jgi:hypothetical protein